MAEAREVASPELLLPTSPPAEAAPSAPLLGLSADEAARRLAAHGPNELPHVPQRPLVLRFARQFTDLFAIVLQVAAAVTLAAYLVPPHDPGNLQLGAAILGVVVLNAAIGFLQEYSAERTAEALRALVPEVARVVRDGELAEVPARALVPGDLVVLEAGDSVSADCRVLEASQLSVDMAALTGESRPVTRMVTAPTAAPALERADLVFMGTSVVTGRGKAVVLATGIHTEFGRVYRLTAGTSSGPSPLQRQVARMARRVVGVALSVGALLFAVRLAGGSPLVAAFVFALGVMVALVPEGLPATLSVSLAIGVRQMARRNALVKKLLAVEALGSTTVICTDKTGTLTTAEMTLQAVWEGGRRHAVTGVGYEPAGAVEDAGAAADVLRAGLLCSNARLLPPDPQRRLGWRVLGDTTEGAILVAARKAGLDVAAESAARPRLAEFPFDSVRKRMTTVHADGAGLVALVKGAPQEVLPRCRTIRWDGAELPLDGDLRRRAEAANDTMSAEALRVLAVARRRLPGGQPSQREAEGDLELLGLVGMLDPPRPEVTAAVGACRRAGIRLVMVTGDYGLTAEAIARRLGMVTGPQPRILTARDLDALDDGGLRALLGSGDEVIFARVRPEDKLRVVTALRDLGEVVAVTGDGVNDAPALKRADIGVAMGRSGTDVAREAADMILLDDSFASIVAAVELGRSVYQNIRKFLIYLFSHNIGELAPILAATVVAFPLVPLTALQVLAIDLGSDVMPALALGAERPEPGVMDRPPRSAREPLFSLGLVGRFLFLGAIQSTGVIVAFFWKVHSAGLPFSAFEPSNPVYREALTMTQAGIVVGQFFNGFAVRTDVESIVRVGPLSNWRLVVAEVMGLAIMASISYLPPLQALFHTAPLSAEDWLLLVAFGVLLLLAEEARKALLRARRRRMCT
ncbi:MAG TPA: cation-transporting P-type ATPase [Candidatus Dormibacteraeota bacterium]|nr:cation-transporting P-type ATPase [Candidatus Dormibacteraeota bacterium]